MAKQIKQYTERDKKLYKIFQFSKQYPSYGAKKILNLELPLYQKDMMHRLWWNKFPLFLCSRRTGKSFIIASGLLLKCILYPKTKVGLVAPVFRQSKNVFKQIEEVIKGSPFAQSQLASEPRHSSSEWVIEFKNDSRITAVPLSDNVRSYG